MIYEVTVRVHVSATDAADAERKVEDYLNSTAILNIEDWWVADIDDVTADWQDCYEAA